MTIAHVEMFAALARPFPPGEIKQRPQGGRQMDYITARQVMNRLDDVLGPAGWWDDYTPLENSVICRLTIRLPDGSTVTKCDAGGHAGMSDQGDDEKSGFSDAFKRAAVKFGVGRHLYRDGIPAFAQPNAARLAPEPPKPHHAANHSNGTGHGSGAYATPATVKDYAAWAEAFVAGINAKWLDAATDGGGNIKVDAELVTTWQLTGHLLKHARASGIVNAPPDVAAGQREKFMAVAWDRHRPAVEAEAAGYCRHLWREAKAKAKAKQQPAATIAGREGGDDIPDDLTDSDVWPAGKE